MIVTTSNEIQGIRVVGYLGVVRGVVVRSPTIGQGLLGGLSAVGGGSNETFAQVADAARQEAYIRMVAGAQTVGADAVIAMRYDACEFEERFTEVIAYGTAVMLDVAGIGVHLGTTQFGLSITALTAGGGAAASGLQVGDQLLAIDTDPVDDVSTEDIARRLQGTIGSTVALAVKRVDGHVERVEVTRKRLPRTP
jgi:uncharacterized protein YbjQ (UPF0145 family)|nr:heavy metal-binding domain-containing protein [Kofleriaceae bacterium]